MKQAAARILLVLASSLAGVGLVEFAWPLVAPAEEPDGPPGYMLFGGAEGSAFVNVGRFFLYRPSSVIRAATYYESAGVPVREFEYQFHTNNLGLVQKDDVDADQPSILLLGDSFTEGQGAEPWFEQVAPDFRERGLQPINGGLLGTGVRQWILLDEHLRARNIGIRKTIVIFISEDFQRPVWNFPPAVLGCLSSYLHCAGGEEFYGMPPDALRATFLAKLAAWNAADARRQQRWAATERAFGEARTLAADLRKWLWARWASKAPGIADDPNITQHVQYFVDRYGADLVFVHLPVKTELGGELEESGIAARAAITAAGAKFFDGLIHCGLTEADYYVTDDHPNAAGYAKIAACVREAARMIL